VKNTLRLILRPTDYSTIHTKFHKNRSSRYGGVQPLTL